MIHIILLAFAFVFFALATFGVTHPRINLVAAGLAFWVTAVILSGYGH